MLRMNRKRFAGLAIALATLIGASAMTPAPAEARRWHRGGGALAFGIGALVVGSIIASQHRRHHRYYYGSSYPAYGYYYAPRYRYGGGGGHWGHHHRREYMNSGR